MKTFNVLILGLLLINQSVNSQSINDKIIRIKSDLDHLGQIKMSELFNDIRYIPLETNPNCLLGYMGISVFGKDIIIRSADERMDLFRFSDDGRFINKIGNRGRGPTEYPNIVDVILLKDTIYILSTTREIICYSLTGTFLKRNRINLTCDPKSITRLANGSFIISLGVPSKIGRLITTDKSYNIQSGFMNNRPLL